MNASLVAMKCLLWSVVWLCLLGPWSSAGAADGSRVVARAGAFPALTEPPCSYCSTQNRKNLVRPDDRAVAWLRGDHNGGAIPLRHFLTTSRVVNDTYGLFFYDPEGGYVSVFQKDYGYEFYGWRGGVMVARSRDGTLWSALSGLGLEGPQKGKRLQRIPSLVTDWGHWLMLHPESTTYDLYDGRKYPQAELPAKPNPEAWRTRGKIDPRLEAEAIVLGVETRDRAKAFPMDLSKERACFRDTVGGESVAVFWFGPTRSAVAFSARLGERPLTFYADSISPETAPFKDKETGTRWTLAGRGVDGPLRGAELTWAPGVQCRWYAWAAEYPHTDVHRE